MAKLKEIGFDVDQDDMKQIFPIFKQMADTKSIIDESDLRVIMNKVKEAVR